MKIIILLTLITILTYAQDANSHLKDKLTPEIINFFEIDGFLIHQFQLTSLEKELDLNGMTYLKVTNTESTIVIMFTNDLQKAEFELHDFRNSESGKDTIKLTYKSKLKIAATGRQETREFNYTLHLDKVEGKLILKHHAIE